MNTHRTLVAGLTVLLAAFISSTTALAGDIDKVCKKVTSCADYMTAADCRTMFEGIEPGYAACLVKASCDALNDGTAFEQCEAEVYGAMGDGYDDGGLEAPRGDGAWGAGEPAAPAAAKGPLATNIARACRHLIDDCGAKDGTYDECVQIWTKEFSAVDWGADFAGCTAESTCESIDAQAPDACQRLLEARRQEIQQQGQMQSDMQRQHHESMMNIIGNMGAGSTEVKDQNGNTLYTY